MYIIYHCYGSAHSSVIASAIHVGMLPKNRIPSTEEIITIPHFDQTRREEIGNPFYIGRDEYGIEVYIIGMANNKEVLIRSIDSLLKIYNIPENQLVLVNSLSQINMITRVGGYLSRRLGMVKVGRPLTIKGVKKAYYQFVDLVDSVKERIRESLGQNPDSTE
ncbi:DUF3189 family protein [Candidatus Contubernalis alkaliaceticus]|uniref:DUF3189 family protein n=1 Tax=Candidatus Contubernalis alkaliaceticus TaxID=338645 RepID=UPI001F4C508E|nr:DUF3189 family protein [Candidatus Contubernalis alkalaceticus]UNC92474.1 DUF3189 family protein [Candidatus Contubernalis alkalaceticus]